MVSHILVVALLTGALVAPSTALAILPPPADGQKTGLGPGSTSLYIPYEYPAGSGTWYAGGVASNRSGDAYTGPVNVVNPTITIEYVDSSYTHVGYETFRVGASILPAASLAGYYYFFHHRQVLPPGADPSKTRLATEVPDTDPAYPRYFYGTAASTANVPLALTPAWGTIDSATLGGGRTIVPLTVTNDSPDILNANLVSAVEQFGVSSDYAEMEVTADNPAETTRLAPGESTTFTLRGLRATPGPVTRTTPYSAVVMGTPLANANVYRFYNLQTGTHFYTADPAEKANVQANLSATYLLDGLAYSVREATPENNAPLYRFYNRKTSTHFYTADPAEKTTIETTMASIFTYEGIAYYVSHTAPAGSRVVWRFFNLRTGTHFYTADPAEKADIQANLSAIYHLDGIGYYLAP